MVLTLGIAVEIAMEIALEIALGLTIIATMTMETMLTMASLMMITMT